MAEQGRNLTPTSRGRTAMARLEARSYRWRHVGVGAGMLIGLFFAASAQAACGDGGTVDGIKVPGASESPTVAEICKTGALRAAVAPFPPHGFQDAKGDFRGAGVEIV